MKSFPLFVSTLSLISLLSGCYQVPVTGRRAMDIVDEKEVTKMSIAAFNDLKAHHPRSRDRERIDQLNRVGERIAAALALATSDHQERS